MIVSQSFVMDFHSFLFVFFLFLLYPLPYLTSVLRRKQKTCMRLLYPLICARVLAAVKCGQALFFFSVVYAVTSKKATRECLTFELLTVLFCFLVPLCCLSLLPICPRVSANPAITVFFFFEPSSKNLWHPLIIAFLFFSRPLTSHIRGFQFFVCLLSAAAVRYSVAHVGLCLDHGAGIVLTALCARAGGPPPEPASHPPH